MKSKKKKRGGGGSIRDSGYFLVNIKGIRTENKNVFIKNLLLQSFIFYSIKKTKNKNKKRTKAKQKFNSNCR